MATGKNNEQLYSAITEYTGEAIVVVRIRKIEYCNARAVALSGYTEKELLRMPWIRFIHPDDREMVLWECGNPSRRRQGSGVYSLRVYDRAKNPKWLEIHHKSIQWNGTDATMVFLRDITEQKRLEAQYLQAQKMEAVGRLAGGIAHDFNNFLTVILGATEVLEIQLSSPADGSAGMEEIREAAKKASALTHQLLAFSRKQHLEPKVIDPNGLVAGMRKMLERVLGKNIEIILRTRSTGGSIHADANQLEQAILNLGMNAKDAMSGGGRLIVATENVEFTDESLKPNPEMRAGRYVMLSISDTGTGMDAATRSHLFEPFFTTKESGRGTGLGLATVYGIVKQSKGHIHVCSEPGKGTTFKLYFPRIDNPPEDALPPHSNTKTLEGTENILVLEDEQQVLKIIEAMLRRRGYTVLTAANREHAIAQSRVRPGSLDLFIADVGIPDSSGRAVWDTVRKGNPNCRVLFISGYPEDFVPLEDLADGTKIFLQKPFGSVALLTRVREILDSRNDHFP